MWEVRVEILGSREWKELQAAGWEPFNFVLVDAPVGPGQVIVNGSVTMNWFKVIGMRKFVPKDPDQECQTERESENAHESGS